MSSVMVKLLASAALPALVLPSVVSETSPCSAFTLVTLSASLPCAASAAAAMIAAAKTATTNCFKANACLELIVILLIPSPPMLYLSPVEVSLRLLHHSDGSVSRTHCSFRAAVDSGTSMALQSDKNPLVVHRLNNPTRLICAGDLAKAIYRGEIRCSVAWR